MSLQGLRTAIYYVSDLEKAKKWYAEFLEAEPYFDTPYYVGFNVGGYELGLHPIDEDKKSSGVHTYWGVEKIDQTYAKLLEMGATEVQAPENVGGPITVAMVQDPWGNELGIIYNPEFKLPE